MEIAIELINPPFNPTHNELYGSFELLREFEPNDPVSVVRTLDFRSYIYFQQQGRTTISDPYAAMMEALHDASLGRGLNAFLESEMKTGRRPVAIMGGHNEPRGSNTYREVARIAQILSESGFIVASGGGPGCMEATHLGALFAERGEDALKKAIDYLATGVTAELPQNMTKVLSKKVNGTWVIDENLVAELHAWMLPAWKIAQEFKDKITPLNRSLAIPTWHYGHEPFTPLATHVSKYFLNSIREDVLLTLATCGIIFSEGRGGTLQEVFQGAAQIYYREKERSAPISSMVFYNTNFWTTPKVQDDKLHLPTIDLLRQLFVGTNNMTSQEFDRYIRLVDNARDAVDIIIANAPSADMIVSKLRTIGVNNINPLQMAGALESLMNAASNR